MIDSSRLCAHRRELQTQDQHRLYRSVVGHDHLWIVRKSTVSDVNRLTLRLQDHNSQTEAMAEVYGERRRGFANGVEILHTRSIALGHPILN